jgi:competence protein ComEC
VANASATARLFKDSARPREVSAGAAFTLDGVLLEVLWPPAGHATKELNDMSVVLRLTYGSTTFLLTGDLEEAAGRELIKRWNVAATVLKVPHHGAKTMGPAFFTAVSPRIAVISVGAGNRFGHPAQQTLDALAGAEVLRTDTSGRVTVTSDGERVTTHTSR